MNFYGNPLSKLIDALTKLPGIGSKSAQRLAFHIINQPPENVRKLTSIILEARESIKYCQRCCNFTDESPCTICKSTKRDQSTVMVVEEPKDMAAYERTGEFSGTYHVLHGAISPLNSVGPGQLKIKELLERLKTEPIQEIILATNPNTEGEATAMYINKLLKPLGVKVTRIAHGVPIGGDLEHVDRVTLSRALEGRREMG